MFDQLESLINRLLVFTLVSLFVLLPLAIWKLVEICIWLYQHINISWS